MADAGEVYAAAQDAALMNVDSAMADPTGGPKFRPGTAQLAGTTFSGETGSGPTGVMTEWNTAAVDQLARLQASAQMAINTGSNGVVDQPTPAD